VDLLALQTVPKKRVLRGQGERNSGTRSKSGQKTKVEKSGLKPNWMKWGARGVRKREKSVTDRGSEASPGDRKQGRIKAKRAKKKNLTATIWWGE